MSDVKLYQISLDWNFGLSLSFLQVSQCKFHTFSLWIHVSP